MNFKDASGESLRWKENIFLYAAIFLQKINFVAYLLVNLGNSIKNINRAKNFKSSKFYSSLDTITGIRRESLWKTTLDILESKPERYVGLEFGVAWGYCSNWWLTRSEKLIEWHGFDTFTGLPEKWRSYPRGYFSNNGNVPNINDERVIWHKGLVEDTITELPSELILNNSLLIIFDLDLFKPTMHCINYLRKYLKPGDLIYFDEPHDEHESTIINYLLLEDNSRFKTVLCTPCHLLMVYE